MNVPRLLACLCPQGFLGAALLVEGLLFGFHLKGTALDWRLHFLLVLVIMISSLVTWAEILQPHSVMLSTLRAQLVMLQGVWFCQIAQILFRRMLHPFHALSCVLGH